MANAQLQSGDLLDAFAAYDVLLGLTVRPFDKVVLSVLAGCIGVAKPLFIGFLMALMAARLRIAWLN